MAAAPTAMKMPRKISAKMMPTMRANCCRCRGTFSVPMMMTKMNRLSMDKLYSVSQPAKNSPAYRGPEKAQTPRPNKTASPTKMPMKIPASFIEGSCGRRPMMKTSIAKMASITTTVMIHAEG